MEIGQKTKVQNHTMPPKQNCMNNQESTSFSVALVNLGCRVNHAEIEKIRLDLEELGGVVTRFSEAAFALVNSCAVTGEAESKTRKTIRRLVAEPHIKTVYVTGCAAYLFPDELEAIAGKVRLVPNKEAVSNVIAKDASSFNRAGSNVGQQAEAKDFTDSCVTAPLNQRNRREIKIQEGCSNACSYCIVWKARGAPRSVPVFSIKEQVEAALNEGIGEIVLAGINLGKFRLDLNAKRALSAPDNQTSLATLIQVLLDETKVRRIRLSSIEPTDIDDSLLEVMARNPERVAAYLHVPLQAGSDRTLKSMNRAYTKAQFKEIVSHIREKLPSVALATDIIVGFPGESEEDFEESLSLAAEINFTKMHIFRYSKRPGTPAAARADQIPAEVKAARAKKMAKLAEALRERHAENLKGKKVRVYVEEPGRGKTEGLMEAKVPKRAKLADMYQGRVHNVEKDVLYLK